MNILKHCLQEYVKVGDDFYYSTLYAGSQRELLLARCSLIQLIFSTAVNLNEASVVIAKLDWWQSAVMDRNNNHPITHYLLNQAHDRDWITNDLVPLIQSLVQYRLHNLPPQQLQPFIGAAIYSALGGKETATQLAELIGSYWLIKHGIETSLVFSHIAKPRNADLSVKIFYQLIQLWISNNPKMENRSIYYEPSAVRKLFNAWFCRIFG